MRVSVYRLPDGSMDVMVEASPGSGKSPVLVQGVTQDNVIEAVHPLVVAQKGRRVEPETLP